MTPEQARAAEEFRKLRGVDPFGPFLPLLQSPELMLRVGALRRANTVLGEQGVIDAIGICGYYAMLAMVLNSAST